MCERERERERVRPKENMLKGRNGAHMVEALRIEQSDLLLDHLIMLNRDQIDNPIDPSLSATLKHKWANQSVASASFDQGSDNYAAVLHGNSCNIFRSLSFPGWFCGFRAHRG